MDFWTRRKQAVKEEERREAEALEAKEADAKLAELEEKTDEEILEELQLPEPETLQIGDDFKPFLAKTVPERLRRRALRKLWLVNPTLANLDGLIDYGEDFTDAALVVENLQTAYQVGKGMYEHVLKMEEEAKAAEEAEREGEILSESELDEADDSENTVTSEEGVASDSSDNPENELTEADSSGHTNLLDVSEETELVVDADDPEDEEASPEAEEILIRPGRRMRFS